LRQKGGAPLKPGEAGALRIWHHPDFLGPELRLGTSFQHPYPRHWHEEFFFSAITAGGGHFGFRGEDHVAGPGTLVLILPGEVHTHYDSQGGRSFRSLHLPPSVAMDLAAEITECSDPLARLASQVITAPRIVRAFLRFHRAMESSGTRLRHESLLRCFFADLVASFQGSPRDPAPRVESHGLRLAQEFLHAHYHRPVSLRHLAATARLSPYHFHRAFCRMIGMPPHAYQVHLRILRAKTLLREGESIAAVASATGFTDQSHFTRHFKRFAGVTPARYASHRKNVQDARR
jgi:AraC-like DNA-binding protein